LRLGRTRGLVAYPSAVADERTVSGPLAQLPNALTVARLVVIPVFAWLILSSDGGYSWAAAILFALAAVTDQIDGFLARRWHVESSFGKIADPLADRLLIDVAVVLLWYDGRLPWAALLIPARDVFVIVATPLVVGRGYRFEVNMLGKAATWLLYLSLCLVMVVHNGSWPLVIFWVGFGLGVTSLVLYGRKARKEIGAGRGREHSQVEVDG
jgi:CDP-diacylglycerol--glycerol-3-phosphate 3-phosphatidyltransferase